MSKAVFRGRLIFGNADFVAGGKVLQPDSGVYGLQRGQCVKTGKFGGVLPIGPAEQAQNVFVCFRFDCIEIACVGRIGLELSQGGHETVCKTFRRLSGSG